MDTRTKCLRAYRELADWYERRGQAPMRDRFLVLAADAALAAGQADEAERLRQRLLQLNPHHMLKPYSSFAQALEAPDVSTYVRDLRQNYPLEVAEELMRTLRANEDQAPQALPPTAPVINLDPDDTLALGSAPAVNRAREEGRKSGERPAPTPSPRGAEPLKVYQLRDDDDATIHADPASTVPPAARPAPRKEPAPAARSSPRPTPRAAPRPAAVPPVFAPAPAPVLEPQGGGGGAWLASLLFGVVATAGVALAVYTLSRPF